MIIVRNRVIALSIRILLFAGMMTAFVFYFLEMSPAWRAFCFLEVQVGLAYLIILFFEIIFNAINLRNGIRGISAGFKSPVTLLVMGYCFIASTLYFTYVIPVHSYLTIRSMIFHIVLIVVPLLNWLLFEVKGNVRYFYSFISLLYPMIFVIFSMFRAVIWPNDPLFTPDVMYIYHFFSPSEPPFVWAIWVAAAIVVASFAIIITIHNLLARKWRRTLSPIY